MDNPRMCPTCGESVMRPVETSEPGAETHELRTDDFDIDEALSHLETPEQDKTQTANPKGNSSDAENPDDTSSEEGRGLLERLRSLF